MQVSVLSCEHTCMTTQHYIAFQCFIVSSAMEIYDNTADCIVSFLHALLSIHLCFVRFSKDDITSRSTLIKTGQVTRKDSVT